MKIEIKNLTKKIKGNTVLENVNHTFESGRVYGLHGRNGSGKTMLLRSICGLILPTEGSVVIDGKVVGKGTHEELLKNCEVYLQIAKSQLSEKELGLEKLGLAEEKAEKETNKKEILSTKIDEKENNKLKKKSDDRKLKHKKGGK